MLKMYNKLLKMTLILAIPSLAHATYAVDATEMNEYCATHSSSYAQQKCANYFQGYWYENENYYYDGHYNDEEPYNYYPYPYVYPDYYTDYYPYYYYNPYYYPANVTIENEGSE